MYRHISDFIDNWKEESDMTITVFKAVADEKKAHKMNENVRSLERLAWHLVQTLTEMPHKAGLLDTDTLEQQPIPSTMQEIIEKYKNNSKQLVESVEKKWKDENLSEEVNMYGFNWTKSKILSIILRHQIHHRGQMTALMRVLDMKVPGVYGPSKEEWVQYGMPVQE